jgi:F0F1-type ATP synthase membrane subunit c/vacuolar-type H+-ATPase subunit K
MTPPPIQDITLRDYFAAAALQGLAAHGNTVAQGIAKAAYILADAMIKERNRDPS